MKKIVTIIGARPQFVKAATVSRALLKCSNIEEIIIHTGQHFDKNMSKIFFDELDIPTPKYNLNINSLSHGAMTGRMLEKIEEILLKEEPQVVLVYGDTNSTLAGALAAQKLNIKIAHVEAGLRSYDMQMPEEVNRILTDRISSFLYCPTDKAIRNLKSEGFDNYSCEILNSGDVMYDAALYFSQTDTRQTDRDYLLCTIHRQENTDNLERLTSIASALNDISKKIEIILPLHPRTKKILDKNKITINANIVEPVGYKEIIGLIKNAKMVMTDSGGMQKEAYFFNKYCITLRDTTEWTELVDNNVNSLVGASKELIVECFNKNLNNKIDSNLLNLYGKGNASVLIARHLNSNI